MSRNRCTLALLLSLCAAPTALSAQCPRTKGENAQRIVPAVLYFPLGLAILAHEQSRVLMPDSGARVRVSSDTSGKMRFTEGRFIGIRDSAIVLEAANRDTVTFPLATSRCLQVYRRSRALGAGRGVIIGAGAGLIVGGVALSGENDPLATFAGAVVGSVLGSVIGPIVGAVRGGTAWDVAWAGPEPIR